MSRLTKKPRVLVLNHFALPPGVAGGTRHIEMFDALHGYDFAIIAANRVEASAARKPKHAHFRYVPVIGYRHNGVARILNWISYAVTAAAAGLCLRRFDIVYASSPHLLAGLAGLVIAKSRRAAFVLEVRDLWPKILVEMGGYSSTSLVYRVLERLERALYRNADRIVILAPGSADHIADAGVPRERISYIPNASDVASSDGRSRDDLRAHYGFRRRTAVYAGAHGPANGLEQLLESVSTMVNDPIDYVLVGDGVSKPELEKRAQELGLGNVRFMAPIPKTEIPALLRAADVGLHVLRDVPLFRYGISPNKVFDYMAAGLPIVSNSPGIVADLVDQARAGWVTEPKDIAGALEVVGTMERDDLVALGRNGQRWIEANQSRAAMSLRLNDVLDAAIEESRVGRRRGRLGKRNKSDTEIGS